jgi:hypothetical protein
MIQRFIHRGGANLAHAQTIDFPGYYYRRLAAEWGV